MTKQQMDNIEEEDEIDKAEVIILFIGIGNYPIGEFLTTRSARNTKSIDII